MTKRVIAVLVAASLSLASAGCKDSQGNVDPGLTALAVVTAPIWFPLARPGGHGISDSSSSNAATENKALGRALLRANAENGDEWAQWLLGKRYFDGAEGVEQNDVEAANWYRRSAEQGYSFAQIALGVMYEWGRGAAPDVIQADKWYSVAVSTTTVEGGDPYPALRAAQLRDHLEMRMTPEQIAEARKRAQEWKPTKVAAE